MQISKTSQLFDEIIKSIDFFEIQQYFHNVTIRKPHFIVFLKGELISGEVN